MNDLKKLLNFDTVKSAVVFCNKKTDVDNISKYTFEQIKSLNTRLVEFYTKLDSAQLSI